MTPKDMTPEDSHRSPVVRLVVGLTGRDPGRRHHPALRWLRTRLGRSPERASSTAACRQCGEWAFVSVLRLSHRGARYWCRRCGAVVTLAELTAVRPIAQLRDGPPASAAPPERPQPAGEAEPDVREVMPAPMLRWIGGWSRKPITLARLDKPTTYQLYREWDTYLQRTGPAGAAALAAGDEIPPLPGLPVFSRVIGALHDACYHTDLASASLLDAGSPLDGAGEAIRERVEHARRWLALRGSAQCWVHSGIPKDGIAIPDRPLVEAALGSLRSGDQPDPAAGWAARAALFGTDRGPGVAALLRIYPAEEMISALMAFLESGARPLREDVLARLTAPLDARYGRR